MNWFSVPPHISVGTTFRTRAVVTSCRPAATAAARRARDVSGAAGVLERHGQPRDAEEIELVGDRVKHRRDEKRDERDLDARRERREIRERRILARTPFHGPRAAEAEQVQPGEQQEARDAEVDGVLQIGVVDRPPRRSAARLVERDHVLPEPDADDRVVRRPLRARSPRSF